MVEISNPFFRTNRKFSSLTLLDLYLSIPVGPTIEDLIPTIYFIISLIPPENIQELFGDNIDINPLLSKYGRFWFDGDRLYYRNSEGDDISVDKIEIGRSLSQNELIAWLNDQIIPIVALEQLRVLIKTYGQNTIYAPLSDKINKYSHEIQDIVHNSSYITG